MPSSVGSVKSGAFLPTSGDGGKEFSFSGKTFRPMITTIAKVIVTSILSIEKIMSRFSLKIAVKTGHF